MTLSKRINVVEGLFSDTPDGPRLTGSRCSSCETPYFPRSEICHNPDCGESKIEDALFGPTGKIWSVAMQDYPPPSPVKFDEPYEPYAMGIVDLPEGLRVLGRIATDDPKSVEVGMDVELILDALCHDEDGNEIVSWKFRPL
ncbi:MAG: Zn-ribbon domain-containing OB-fold protein [Candidatus Binatia bacterium]